MGIPKFNAPIGANFFRGSTVKVARNLLGTYLAHKSRDGLAIGRIVETEAYLGNGDDPACHAHRGRTKRNAVMFGPAGFSYVYFIYGMYFCFNVVTRKEGVGEAVLIRALEPVVGTSLMTKRRKGAELRNLCNGPGKLVLALGLTGAHNGLDLRTSKVRILAPSTARSATGEKIVTATRIGLSKAEHLPLRFYLAGSEFVSKM